MSQQHSLIKSPYLEP